MVVIAALLGSLAVLAFLFYLWYLTIFIIVHKNQQYLEQTKALYNKLKLSNFNSVIVPFQLLRSEKKALEQPVKLLKSFQESFNSEINSALEQLLVFSEPKALYNCFWFNRNIKLLRKNLQGLHDKQQRYVKLTKNAIAYFDSSYDTLVFYRQAFCLLVSFINDFLVHKYDSLFYLNIINRISLLFKDVELHIKNKDVKQQNQALNKLHNNLAQTIITASRQYFFDVKVGYLNYHFQILSQKVTQLRSMKNKAINSQEVAKFQELITNIGATLAECSQALGNINLALCEQRINQAKEQIDVLSNAVSVKEKAISLVVSNVDSFLKSINHYQQQNALLQTLMKEIELMFQNNLDTVNIINQINEHSLLIAQKTQLLNQENALTEFIDYEKLFRLMSEAMKLLDGLKNLLNELFALSANKFDDYRFFVYTLDDFRFKFFQIENLIANEELIISEKTLKIISQAKHQFDDIFTQAKNDYEGAFSYLNEKVRFFQNQLTHVIVDVVGLMNLRSMCKHTFIFANKYRQESPQINESLETLTQFYQQQNYSETLSGLISLLGKIKSSAKQHHLDLN
ncbi:septation ring formation regulator EzrA [Mycoplasmoides pneumoniae]|uniref:Uncharacterized protein MG397 homolog n=1 Tax=Mycoplasma pneumoniae (strain ATCC 29342 / M129 / Subtype 1) TaxID=272634 RepID=Y596_MYCPN|nr:septation ring formation regulator EzrA [Mycoplasmoides pneumoniae]Q50333.1 RecName: Full=Uncharacterized protein MG397 homolog [Mycoplasmoides pneumoniae M129]AAB95894.1 conserved hypothetical protein [Mycoplasmoides pneumoniae M129]AAC43661.1 D02_orf569 [Mycoplasmoides pneumoniae]AGC04470.1 hypothetical protein C985_0601 [Mycoplasmoides pneumoniae M129-B7]ALA30465.1 hypothetical protein C897_03385 [Mycoplasmoides pneumoniae PI 1428]ALA32571.1 hypothetical protein F533_03385 [Mycoplasmoid